MTDILNPFPYFPEAGTGGYVYIGTAGMDARTNPVTVYRDEAHTLAWAQPIRTVDGYPAYQGAKAGLYIVATDFSLTVLDSNQAVVSNLTSAEAVIKLSQTIADEATTARDEAVAAQAASETAQGITETARDEAVSARDAANSAAAASQQYYPGARAYVPRGLTSVTITAAGTGGTNGTYTCPLTGDNLTVDAYATIVVSGGSVSSVTVAAPGLYIGASPTAGTVDTSSITGLTSATLTPVIGYLKTSGEYWLTDTSPASAYLSLFQNQSNAAVEIDAQFDPMSAGRATDEADRAEAAVGAVLQTVSVILQPDDGLVDGAWYGEFFISVDTNFTLLRHQLFLDDGMGLTSVSVNLNDENYGGPFTVTSTADSDAVTIFAPAGTSRISFQIDGTTGSPGGAAFKLEGLPP